MNWKEFEENMKHQVDGHSSPHDSELFWEKLQNKRDNQRLIWPWILGFTLFLGLGVIFIQHKDNQKLYTQSTVKNISSTNATHPNNTSFSNDKSTDLESETSKTVNAKSHDSSSIMKLVNASQKLHPEKFTPKKLVANKNPLKPKTNVIKPKIQSSVDIQKTDSKVKFDTKKITSTAPFSKTKFSSDDQETSQLIAEPSVSRLISPIQLNQSSNDLPSRLIESAVFLDPLQSSDLVISNFQSEKLSKFTIPLTPKAGDENKVVLPYYLGAYIGYGSWIPSYLANDSISTALLTKRLETETPLDLFQFGFRFKIHKGFLKYFALGLQYNQLNSRFDFDRKWQTQDTVKLPVLNYFVNGDIQTTYLSASVIKSYHRIVRNYNYLRSIQIPIYCTPVMIDLGKFNVSPSLGLIPGIYQNASGKIINSDSEIVLLTEKPTYKSGILLMGELVIKSEYKLSTNQGIFLEGFYSKDLINNSVKNYPIKQQNNSFGLRLGWGMNF